MVHMVKRSTASNMAVLAALGGIFVGGLVVTASPARITEDVPAWDCASAGDRVCVPGDVTVTRHPGETHIVTGDGRLIIVPADMSRCVLTAVADAEYAVCASEG